MNILSQKDIESLNVSNVDILEWVRQSFLNKSKSMLPHKISQSFNDGRNFYNTMPAIIPSIDAAGVKVVSRYFKRNPSIKGELLLYSYKTGDLLTLMDAGWITVKRTGAVAALAVETFASTNFDTIAVIGLGQTGKSFLDMFLTNPNNLNKTIKLKKYKHQAENMREYLLEKGVKNIEIYDNNNELIKDSDVIVSAVTFAEEFIGEDSWFKEGCLVVPIHTRGFQNCDLFFDKVFADDTAHVEGFKHFRYFKEFNEIDKVLKGEVEGRVNNSERILSYNIGIALHDVYCAKKIYDRSY